MLDWVAAIAVVGLGLFPAIFSSIRVAFGRSRIIQEPFTDLASGLVTNLGLIALIVFVASADPRGLASIGLNLNLGQTNWMSIVWALFALEIVLVVWSIVLRLTYRFLKRPLADVSSRLAGFDFYRTGNERLAYMLTLMWAVAAEDLIFRGYLVMYLGSRTGFIWPWVVVSISLSVLAHLYQGRSMPLIVGHALIAATMIGLVMWTGNIIGLIGAHFLLDGVLIFRRWHRIVPESEPQQSNGRGPQPQGRFAVLSVVGAVLAIGVAQIL